MTNEQKVEAKRFRIVKGTRYKLYPVPEQDVLDKYPVWVIVRHHPDLTKSAGTLIDSDDRWWLPISWSGVDLRRVYWLDVVRAKFDGREWESLCRACDKRLFCTADGRGVNPKHRCTARKENLVEIMRRPRREAAS